MIKCKGDWMTVTAAGQSVRVPFSPQSSLLSPAGRATLVVASHLLGEKLGKKKSKKKSSR